ncbi:MAG: deoxynucleoside kinase, partial [Polyangia bacterium]
ALRPRVTAPDLVVYLQARAEVLLERVEKRGRPEEKPIRREYLREVAKAYSEFFFSYNDGPLLIVDASEIDFVGNAEDRAALLEVIAQTRAGVNHWSRR